MTKPRNVGDPVREKTQAERQAEHIQNAAESRARHITNAVKLLKDEGWRIVKTKGPFEYTYDLVRVVEEL